MDEINLPTQNSSRPNTQISKFPLKSASLSKQGFQAGEAHGGRHDGRHREGGQGAEEDGKHRGADWARGRGGGRAAAVGVGLEGVLGQVQYLQSRIGEVSDRLRCGGR